MQNYIRYKNTAIAYSDSGTGIPVVLLHGFLENSKMWKHISLHLETTNRVITIDLLGHGNTQCIGDIHTMKDMALAVKAVLKYLNIKQSYIIGHSMGGYVSLAFAEEYPKQIKGICLLNSTAQQDSPERKKLRSKACKIATNNYQNLVKIAISSLFNKVAKKQFSIEIEALKKEALKTPFQGYINATKGMQLRNNKEIVLKNIKKKLIIAGKNDTILSYENIVEEAHRTQTPLVKITCGHMPHIEQKEELLQKIKEFIKTD
ncbi:alpha/beta fold hydrolase [Tenacibaculum piscium]|uniref:alpha/beta fold hydrolase n=1 Tax=Tenacibaculum piscium TaxID=1458515 RepID=UPI001F2D1458|nr:alpha/beta hydrolase [Tenacibaculum piscium]MCG8183182.1 alpha/beta hydrolase [Tenacibaculum piscium]MCG8204634.1 alpha/beta hydrolase [Tenacibaculum piscium]